MPFAPLRPHEQISLIAAGKLPAQPPAGDGPPKTVVVGLPAHGEADELALLMLGHLLQATRCEVVVDSARKLIAEILARVEQQHPAAACHAALPPGGLAQARNLCERLRAQYPDLKIVVGRWGQEEDSEPMKDFLRSA